MNVARTITMIRTGNASAANKRAISSRLEGLVVASVTWLISKPAIQNAIVGQFENKSTPMCAALRQAVTSEVTSQVEGITVDADCVDGLSRYVEGALEQLNAGDLKDFDDAVEEAVKKTYGNTDEIVEEVLKEIRNRLRA